MRLRLWPCLTAVLALLAVFQVLMTPCLTLNAEGRRLALLEADGAYLVIDFIHSVQKTPVEERLVVEGASLKLVETRYHSFGVGLPFLAEEGRFSVEGNDFVLRGQDRRFPELKLRTGVGTRLTLTLGRASAERAFPLYEHYRPGALIEVKLLPLYRAIIS